MNRRPAGTAVYVDGLNLYYGSLRGTEYRWLDLVQLFRILLPTNDVERIKYFTAKVRGRGNDTGPPDRQETYLRALATRAEVEVIFGHFLVTKPWMRVAEPDVVGFEWVKVVKTEEKGSDVNLATHLIHDGHLGLYETAVVVSNDSDLGEAVRLVREELGLRVGVVSPYARVSSVLRRHATFIKVLRKGVLAKSQFRRALATPTGLVHRPASWD
jgi:uncharacterized LabA/DUF88 family protein